MLHFSESPTIFFLLLKSRDGQMLPRLFSHCAVLGMWQVAGDSYDLVFRSTGHCLPERAYKSGVFQINVLKMGWISHCNIVSERLCLLMTKQVIAFLSVGLRFYNPSYLGVAFPLLCRSSVGTGLIRSILDGFSCTE